MSGMNQYAPAILGLVPGGNLTRSATGYETVVFLTFVNDDRILPLNPQGPFGVEGERVSFGGHETSFCRVALGLAASELNLHGAVPYYVSVTKYLNSAISKAWRRSLLSGKDPQEQGEVYPTPEGWLVVGVNAVGTLLGGNSTLRNSIVTQLLGDITEEHIDRSDDIKALVSTADFWSSFEQQQHQQKSFDISDVRPEQAD